MQGKIYEKMREGENEEEEMRKEPEMKEGKMSEEKKKTVRNKEVTEKERRARYTTDGRTRTGVKDEEEIRKER